MKQHRFLDALEDAELVRQSGVLIRMNGEFLEADGPFAAVGDYCSVETAEGGEPLLAEVVAVTPASIRLVPLAQVPRLTLGAKVAATGRGERIAVGNAFAGRAIDGLGRPIDKAPPIRPSIAQGRTGRLLPTLDRVSPKDKLLTGIRALDALLPLGKGQRVGIFAASGVGKTSLIEQIARQTTCDRLVLCLVGERGREVDKLWNMLGSGEKAERFTLVAATSDESASLRLRALEQALALAEYWRDSGDHVLLIVDSVTRAAQALRELGLASGQPPTVRGLTPNVFSALPRFVERCGAARNGGAITAILTVLSETDEVDDPVVELMKSILDGHIVLSRSLAEKRHFPAIDISRSISRLSRELLDSRQQALSRNAHEMLATYEEARPMIESGLYRAGASAPIDQSIALHPALTAFLRQDAEHCESYDDIWAALRAIFESDRHA